MGSEYLWLGHCTDDGWLAQLLACPMYGWLNGWLAQWTAYSITHSLTTFIELSHLLAHSFAD